MMGLYTGFIYKITNNITSKMYIGQTIQKPKARYRRHINSSKGNNKNAIHKSIDKYGYENFSFAVLDSVSNSDVNLLYDKLNDLEIYYISKYNTYVKGYNETTGGRGGRPGPQSQEEIYNKRERMSGKGNPMYGLRGVKNPNYGSKRTQETKNKLSYKKSEDHKRKISESKKGKKIDNSHMKKEFWKKYMSYVNKGKKLSEETKRKIRESRIGKYKGDENPFFGKSHNKASKEKMSNNQWKRVSVIDPITKIIYNSIREASKKTGVSYDIIRNNWSRRV